MKNNMEELNTQEGEQLSKKERRELRREERETGKTQRAKGKTLKRVVSWLAVVFVLGGAVFAISKFGGQTQQMGQNTDSVLSEAISAGDWIKGNPELPVSLVEYADFQCPACGAYHSLLIALEEEFSGKVSFVFRHFPLRTIHPNAEMASRAAEAAGKQDKFWEMRDLLFKNQSEWSNIRGPEDKFVEYAGSLGLDTARFEDDLDNSEIKSKIQADVDSGIKSGVNATPTFFVNGVKISGPQSLEDFRQVLNNALAEITAGEEL